jgi:hypothetical protein
MLKKIIQYSDLDGNQVVDEFWFHLSIAEVLEMEKEVEGGLSTRVRKMIDSKDETKVLSTLRGIVSRAVGAKAADGRRFMKGPEDKSPLLDSDAYSKLLIELMTVDGAAVEFVNGIVPKDLKEQAQAAEELQSKTASTSTMTSIPESPLSAKEFNFPGLSPEDNQSLASTPAQDERDYTDWRTYTKSELTEMDSDTFEMVSGLVGGKFKPSTDKVLLNIAIQRKMRSGAQGGA